MHIEIPLTLAILPALIVSSAGQRFAIPQTNLVEVVRLEAGAASGPVERVCGAPVYRLRDELLPLCFLDQELRLQSHGWDGRYIAVLEAGAGRFGLVVDVVHDREEIVVKPLGPLLGAISCFAGAAILGDGDIVLIIDVAGLAQMAGIAAGPCVLRANDTAQIDSSGEAASGWLIFRSATGSRFALPLSAVTRLEEIPAEHIEWSGGREVVRYRGAILPLLRVSRLFHEPAEDRELLPVAVIHESGSSAGLVVDRIEDIVKEVIELRGGVRSHLLEGSAVIQGRVADVLNVRSLLAAENVRSNPGTTNRSS